MGGCASKPKEADLNPPHPELPATPKKPDAAETISQPNHNGGEPNNNAAPLLDLSEPAKQEAAASEEPPVSTHVADLTAQLAPEKVEAVAKESEENTTTVPASSTETPKPDDTVKSEDKTPAHPVAV